MRPGITSSITTFSLCVAAAGCHDSTGPKPTAVVHPAGTPTSQITGLGGRPFSVRVASTGDILVTEQDLNRAVHVGASQQTNITVGGDPGDVVANRVGTQAFVSSFFDGTVAVVNLTNNTVVKTVAVSPSNAYRLALSADESILYVSSTDGNLYTITTSTQTSGPSKGLGGSLQGLALDHSGHVYVSSTSGGVTRLDGSSLSVLKSATVPCLAQDIALAIDDAELYIACENTAKVLVLDPTSLATKDSVVLTGMAPFGLAVTPDNAQLYVTSPQLGRLTIVDRASRGVVKTLILTGVPRRVAFNARGTRAYVANEGNWVDIIE